MTALNRQFIIVPDVKLHCCCHAPVTAFCRRFISFTCAGKWLYEAGKIKMILAHTAVCCLKNAGAHATKSCNKKTYINPLIRSFPITKLVVLRWPYVNSVIEKKSVFALV